MGARTLQGKEKLWENLLAYCEVQGISNVSQNDVMRLQPFAVCTAATLISFSSPLSPVTIDRAGDSSLELGRQSRVSGDGSPPVGTRGKAPVGGVGRSPPEAEARLWNCTTIFVSVLLCVTQLKKTLVIDDEISRALLIICTRSWGGIYYFMPFRFSIWDGSYQPCP